MFSVRWSADYALGIPEVDTQHQALVDMINALSAGIGTAQEETTTRAMLAQLADYTRNHFALEERLMAAQPIDPEFKARHCGEHAYFIGVLKDFTHDFDSGRGRISAPLVEYLVHWLLHHIVVVDREMAQRLHAADPHIDTATAMHQATDTTAELHDSERHLLAEMQHSITDLRGQLEECAAELAATRAKLAEVERRLADRQATND
jgi:hemerythrin